MAPRRSRRCSRTRSCRRRRRPPAASSAAVGLAAGAASRRALALLRLRQRHRACAARLRRRRQRAPSSGQVGRRVAPQRRQRHRDRQPPNQPFISTRQHGDSCSGVIAIPAKFRGAAPTAQEYACPSRRRQRRPRARLAVLRDVARLSRSRRLGLVVAGAAFLAFGGAASWPAPLRPPHRRRPAAHAVEHHLQAAPDGDVAIGRAARADRRCRRSARRSPGRYWRKSTPTRTPIMLRHAKAERQRHVDAVRRRARIELGAATSPADEPGFITYR